MRQRTSAEDTLTLRHYPCVQSPLVQPAHGRSTKSEKQPFCAWRSFWRGKSANTLCTQGPSTPVLPRPGTQDLTTMGRHRPFARQRPRSTKRTLRTWSMRATSSETCWGTCSAGARKAAPLALCALHPCQMGLLHVAGDPPRCAPIGWLSRSPFPPRSFCFWACPWDAEDESRPWVSKN